MAEEEREEVDQDSYYAILNVARDASEEDIKRSYRQLAQVCHPDKIPTSVAIAGANANFMRIQEAYEILTDEQRRNIYDIYGKEGLEAGFELGDPLRSSKDLKEEYEKFKSQRNAQKEEQSVAHRGVYSFKVDACDALNPYDKDITHLPELLNIATTNSVQLPLSDNTVASLGCQVGVRRSVGGGRFMCGIKRILTPQDTLDVNVSLGYLDAGLKSFVSGTATRQLGEHTSADVTTSWHPQAGVGLSLTTSRRLSPQLEADFTWQVGPESCVILGMTRHGERYLINGRLEAGASTGFVGKVVWQATASISLRASAKLGTMGVELELGGSHRISNFSTAGCSVVAGMQMLDGRIQRIQQIHSAMAEARAASTVLEPVATRKFRKEVEKGGLIILSARYGVMTAIRKAEQRDVSNQTDQDELGSREDLEAYGSQQFTPGGSEHHLDSDSEEIPDAEVNAAMRSKVKKLPEAWLDVTIPLRFQVKDSKLEFHKGISKSQMMGFCDSAAGEDKVLLIYYLWHGKAYTATITDRASGCLPQDGAAVIAQESRDLIRKLITKQELSFDLLQE